MFWKMLSVVFLLPFFGMSSAFSANICLKEVPINIVVLVSDAAQEVDEARAKRFLEILNEKFVSIDGNKYFEFRLDGFVSSEDPRLAKCPELVAFGRQEVKPSKSKVKDAFNRCGEKIVADKAAVNVYIFRSTFDNSDKKKSSRIYFSGVKPFVFMNIDRLDNDWAVWQHEFGHVFGLPEHKVCGAYPDTPTNVMSKPMGDDCTGTGGNRELGFFKWQSAIINAVACVHSSWLN